MSVPGRRETKGASFSQGSDEYYSLVCIPCHRDDTTIPAFGYCIDCHEHLCHTCYTHHKKPTPCRHHRLQDKDAMPSTQQLDTPVPVGPTDNLTVPCPRHRKDLIKFYCRGHDLLLCSICVTLEHNKICTVDYIPDISDNIINGKDYKGTMDRMDKLVKKCSIIETQSSKDINKSNDSLKTALMDITKYRQEVNKRLDELQKEVENKIQALQHQNGEKKKTTDTICEDIKKAMKVTHDSMKKLNTSKQADQLFMEVKQVQKQLQEYENSISSISADDSIEEFTFTRSQAINDVLHEEKMIGEISAKHQARKSSATQLKPVPPSANANTTSTHKNEICVLSPEDSKKRCHITGMTMLPQDRLVLADLENRSIKLVDVNSKLITSQLSLGNDYKDRPWDITSTTNTQVAVTVPGGQHIQFISVSDKLSKSHAIQTDGCCYGICFHQNKLVVTYKNPGKLEILDMNGQVMTIVAQDSVGDQILDKPIYVHANSSSIYVSSEGGINYITLLNWQGKITGKTADFHLPKGLAMLGDGRLFISSYGGDKVIQGSGDITNTQVVLQGVRSPYAVCVDDGGHKLYVSRCTYRTEDNIILVYNI